MINERRGDGGRGNSQSVDTGVRHDQMELLDELFAHFEGFQIDRGGDLCSHFQPSSDIVTVFGGTGGKPAGLLMVVDGLRPGDLVAGSFSFFQKRERDFLKPGA